jgi:DNA-binding MarR family transcriptional regulator/N-acetylglutamate synthase-like GNAT family acetyltransferase
MHPVPDTRVRAVRRFNRVYTQRIGALRPQMYGSPLTLAEARVLYELAQADAPIVASDLVRSLDLDPGYLSRILQRFVARRYVRRTPAADDARRLQLALTATGRKAFARIDRASHDETAALLAPLADDAQLRVVAAMEGLERLLHTAPAASAVGLREHRPGDIGWITACHGRLYAQEYGWDATFEALVAEIGARFLRRFDPAWERCWIAELDGEPVGSVMLIRKSATVAQLRLLIVEPHARGAGVGRRLVAACLAFARAKGYRRMMLWTNGGLDAARHLYEEVGFVLTSEERHHSFGKDLVGQTFALKL